MYSMASTRARRFLGAASGLGFLSLAAGTQADVKIVSEVSVTGEARPAFPETVTTYYKGGHALMEVTDGPATLFDGAGGKVYRFDPAKKTYYVLSVKQLQEEQSRLPGQMAERMSLEAKIDLKSSDTAETMAVSGLTARKYDVSGSLSLKPKESSPFGGGLFGGGGFPGGGGGFPGGGGGGFPGGGGGGFPGGGGGGFPGGGGGGFPGGGHHRGGRGGGSRHSQGRNSPATTISGVVWLSDALKLPEDKKANMLPAVQSLIFGGDPALKPLADALNKNKRLPLGSRITVTRPARTSRRDDPNGDSPSDEAGNEEQASPAQTITTTMQVKSLSQETLPEALFQVPPGYAQVAPPSDKPSSD